MTTINLDQDQIAALIAAVRSIPESTLAQLDALAGVPDGTLDEAVDVLKQGRPPAGGSKK